MNWNRDTESFEKKHLIYTTTQLSIHKTDLKEYYTAKAETVRCKMR